MSISEPWDFWWIENRTFIMEFLGREMRNMGGKRFLYLGLRTLNVYEFWTVEWWNNFKYCDAIRLYAFYLSTTLKSNDFISTIRGVNTRLSDATLQHVRTPDCSYLCAKNMKPLTNQIIHWHITLTHPALASLFSNPSVRGERSEDPSYESLAAVSYKQYITILYYCIQL